jgi:hypothetical protein
MRYLTDLETLGGLGQGLAFVAVKAPSPVLLPWSDKANLGTSSDIASNPPYQDQITRSF